MTYERKFHITLNLNNTNVYFTLSIRMERDKHCISYITHFFPNWLNEGMTCEKVILLEKYKTYYFYPSTDKRDANNLYDLKQWKKFTRDILKFVDKE